MNMNCRICDSRLPASDGDIVYCLVCSVGITLVAAPSIAYEDESSDGRSARPPLLVRILRAVQMVYEYPDLFARRGKRILEIGPGDGYLSVLLRDRQHNVTCFESSRGDVRHLQSAGIDARHVVVGVTYFPLAEEYDVVILRHSLEHIDNPLESMRWLVTAMKPTAEMIISVPDTDSRARMRLQSAWSGYSLPTHRFHYNQRSLSTLLSRAGLHVTRVRRLVTPNFTIGKSLQIEACLDRTGSDT